MKISASMAIGNPPINAPIYIAMLNIGPGMHETNANAFQNYSVVKYSASEN